MEIEAVIGKYVCHYVGCVSKWNSSVLIQNCIDGAADLLHSGSQHFMMYFVIRNNIRTIGSNLIVNRLAPIHPSSHTSLHL